MPRKILFIVNPKAGKRMSESVMELVREEFPQNIYYQVVVWRDKEHFDEIIGIMRDGDYTDVVAVGGDGTVNRVAQALIGTDMTLGILPLGSGNGLARSLGLSMQIPEAIKEIAEGKTAVIDTGTVNGIPFFCTSGIGFDAHIGALFAKSIKRGLRSYVQISLWELMRYRARNYKITLNGKVLERKAFLVTVANAGQYGNDLYIAPQADMQDGLFHVVIVKPFNIFKAGPLMHKVLSRKAYLSSSIETFSAKDLVIEAAMPEVIHFDGEPGPAGTLMEYHNVPRSMKAIVGKKFISVLGK